MRVLLLSESEYELATRKIAQELQCARMDCYLMAAWEKQRGYKHYGRAHIRKRRLEASRLERILSR